ncbi:MAG: GEVED domain-containing protein [Saprospiraceae bacterium]
MRTFLSLLFGAFAPALLFANYCPANSNFPWHDWIAEVKTGSIQNPSGKSQYSDFTAQTTALTIGTPAQIELTAGFSYFTFDEYWKVWIDLDHDGQFADPAEAVVSQILTRPADGTPTKTLTINLLVPSFALTGPTRMRVSMKRGAFATPCETLPFGEVEDYTFVVGQPLAPGVPRAENPAQPIDVQQFTVFPNPAGEEVFVQLPDGGAGNFSVKIFDQHGLLRHEQAFEKTTEPSGRISLADFRNGVYWLQIQPENGRAVGRKLVVARMY